MPLKLSYIFLNLQKKNFFLGTFKSASVVGIFGFKTFVISFLKFVNEMSKAF